MHQLKLFLVPVSCLISLNSIQRKTTQKHHPLLTMSHCLIFSAMGFIKFNVLETITFSDAEMHNSTFKSTQ